ncbi:hydrogenase expression/formation protein HypE [Thermoproteus uzoniensis 768-20]|uniref:Hydrogenase expression/formation protein HypE n=1 Tax=Thermoproteus uzoniensis (strain 768-20) TaxID=999630 RepID=F2L308_THEU7|nr:AIR synthase family protein [Thermoproteus uzoniensis]AEA13127.1 hydrogenase expression/formation protein HypE [Thermoproteus uzoniensis 768-20]
MRVGKLPLELVERYIWSRTGSYDPSVLLGPSLGEDAAIIRTRGPYIATHTDPISGSVELLGWLAVHVVSNDLATRGIRPRWLLPTIFLPPSSSEEVLDKITRQMDAAARELGAAIVGGHTEVTTAVERPLVVMAAIGEGDRYVSTGGARPGDLIIMTKSAAMEAAAILATDFRDRLKALGIADDVLERAAGFIRRVSVVKEALLIADLADAMHDPTEGGVLAGLAEMAYASGATIRVDPGSVKVYEEAALLCSAVGLDPLFTLSSGALLAAVPRDKADEALRRLRGAGVEASIIGEVVPREQHLVIGGSIALDTPYVRDRFFELF